MAEYDSEVAMVKEPADIHLRSVNLNLLTVFDAVMQMQNITRAATSLGMSQPAVSNAVARLKMMFNDELFVRSGRGYSPPCGPGSCLGRCVRHCNWCKMSCLVRSLNRLPARGFSRCLSAARLICDWEPR